jgi:hypothetical protein
MHAIRGIKELENIGTYHNLRTYLVEYLWMLKGQKNIH